MWQIVLFVTLTVALHLTIRRSGNQSQRITRQDTPLTLSMGNADQILSSVSTSKNRTLYYIHSQSIDNILAAIVHSNQESMDRPYPLWVVCHDPMTKAILQRLGHPYLIHLSRQASQATVHSTLLETLDPLQVNARSFAFEGTIPFLARFSKPPPVHRSADAAVAKLFFHLAHSIPDQTMFVDTDDIDSLTPIPHVTFLYYSSKQRYYESNHIDNQPINLYEPGDEQRSLLSIVNRCKRILH